MYRIFITGTVVDFEKETYKIRKQFKYEDEAIANCKTYKNFYFEISNKLSQELIFPIQIKNILKEEKLEIKFYDSLEEA
jgi:hypothetical protein